MVTKGRSGMSEKKGEFSAITIKLYGKKSILDSSDTILYIILKR
jgi:hypothetical protein